jgi:hypothetical protein
VGQPAKYIVDPINTSSAMNEDVLGHVLDFLDTRSIISLTRVCKDWQETIYSTQHDVSFDALAFGRKFYLPSMIPSILAKYVLHHKH